MPRHISSTPMPDEVADLIAAKAPVRKPQEDPTLGIAVARDATGEPPHRLVAVGDSLTHGFQSGAIHNTHLSYPALIARELGCYDRFQHPSYDRFGGLPMNIEYFVRELEQRFGDRIGPWEVPFAGMKILDLMDQVEDFWEHDEQDQRRFITRNHNLGVYGWDVHDATTRTAADCRGDICEPTDALLKQVVSNANERAALRVLAPGPEGQELLSPLATAQALGAEGAEAADGTKGDGIETLIVMLGANNALGAVTDLRLEWSAKPRAGLATKRGYTVWDPAHFRAELDDAVALVRDIHARHVIWATVPHVTIAPIARGIGDKVADRSRYFPFYTRPWITDERFDSAKHDHLTADDARAIDYAIDRYNTAIEDAVRAARKDDRDWLLLDVCGLLDRLAARRYIMHESSRPPWWRPYPLPAALRALSPPPDSRFFAADPERGRTQGGLFSLDGVHPTTITYGLMAQEFIRVMEGAGVRFPGSPAPAQIDFAELIRRDSLISAPPRSLSSDLSLIGWIDDKLGFCKRLLSKGP